jgi:O-antigen/teichoic acid export membrane protein
MAATREEVVAEETPKQAGDLIRRAPSGYLWNQAYNFWTFATLFLHQIIITNNLSLMERGIFEPVKTFALLGVYVAALGLDTAGSVYIPRALAEGGPARAAAVALRLILIRAVALFTIAGLIFWGLPALGQILLGFPATADMARAINSPEVLSHRAPMAFYVVAVGMSTLLASLLTALLRTRLIFIVGGLAQLLIVVFAWVFVVTFNDGADGALNALSVPSALAGIAYSIALIRLLGVHLAPLGLKTTWRMMALGGGAWLTDLASGSLLKSIALAQLLAGLAVLSSTENATQVAFFGVAFEMGHAATFLFINGISGVGLAVMSAAYVNQRLSYLAIAWRTISKLQVLLGVPLLIFCVPNATAIMVRLFGADYAPAGPLLALFLGLNALTRLAGGGAHEAALYVLGRARWAVFSRWFALGVLFVLDLVLIPLYGVAGCLLAVGIAQMVAEMIQFTIARYRLRRQFPVAFMLRILLALVPGLILTALWRPTSWIGLISAGLIFALLFLVMLLLLRPFDAEDDQLLRNTNRILQRLFGPFVNGSRAVTDAPLPPGEAAA